MQRLYKVKGDFNLMLNWDDYFGDDGKHGREEGVREAGRRGGAKKTGTEMENMESRNTGMKNTNMNIMLLPWIVFWVAASVDYFAGSLVSVAVCATVPLFFYRNKKTVYDILSGTLVTGMSVAMLAGVSNRIAVPLSYFSFGVMWMASCLFRIPLTAHYSMNGYGGEKVLKNPLFIKTNRILTFLWGILYLITPIWTYYLMGTGIGYLTGAVNSVLPAVMGIFTAWFQRWYPAKVAGG